jgi:hypothetical protein
MVATLMFRLSLGLLPAFLAGFDTVGAQAKPGSNVPKSSAAAREGAKLKQPNAADIYRMAIAEFRRAMCDPDTKSWNRPSGDGKNLKGANNASWQRAVTKSADAIAIFAQASQVPNCEFPRYPKDLTSELSLNIIDLNGLLSLVTAHGWQQVESDVRGACATAIQMLGFMDHCKNHGTQIGVAIGLVAERNATELLDVAASGLGREAPKEIADVLKRLDAYMGRRMSSSAFADVVAGEVEFQLAHGLSGRGASEVVMVAAKKRANAIFAEMLAPLRGYPAASIDEFRRAWSARVKLLQESAKERSLDDFVNEASGEGLANALVLVVMTDVPGLWAQYVANGLDLRGGVERVRELAFR